MTSDNKTPPDTASANNDDCRIYFQGKGPCIVPRNAISKCPILAARIAAKPFFSTSRNSIDVGEMPYDVGVSVAYFLNTGTYRSLDPELDSQDERNCRDLGTAFRVYAAATIFELVGLKNAVQSRMAYLEERMDLAQVARSLKQSGLNLEEYPTLAMHLYSFIQVSKDVSSEDEMKSIISELGFPESVNIDSFQSSLASKGLPGEERDAKATSPRKSPPNPTPKSNSEPESNPTPELPCCSKDKNKVATTVVSSALEKDQPETAATRTWMRMLPKINLAMAFRRKKAVPEESFELQDTNRSVDEIMVPAQGLSDESLASARNLVLSALGEHSEEGDIGLQEGTFQVPAPVKDL
ncbi:hypothetical protein FPOAC1_006442 [Fusarium poae]|uniref:hypothetical protein n=1 Tax=Fusarium poae TaxID=36050 RepID=UPI001CE8AA5D|nr:hypothetical protein FPOAC1_006442 [Fusarium poae]KAG8673138.1 hypothetical protein FPOAC1_006442 [Fusarium poae]